MAIIKAIPSLKDFTDLSKVTIVATAVGFGFELGTLICRSIAVLVLS